ncbi:hypothetical protein [Aquabacterium sp. OR-4]|uniref:hypothetical protein n=1 Tax=Aquabacterium sp. OR-4 TaxID=2978127 RepID=UPI0021B3C3DF|nr:hypothetical protein [Aquabacterium sp. OR-4]MDT7838764.1 hypothetical protein [Aquabacterium sp. OR-4]
MTPSLHTLALALARRDPPAPGSTRLAEAEAWAADQARLAALVPTLAIERATPAERWAWLAEALRLERPSRYLQVLRGCGGLRRWLPEVEALFGVPQLSDGPEWMDVGEHQLRVVDEAARTGQPLAVRFAALMHKIGKGGTPREIWPSHYKHEQRGQALLDALATRLAVPADALALAHLAIGEADRIHRASDVRAGAMAAMLQRLAAQAQPARFEALLQVCTCDFAAYPGHDAASYPKARTWRRALQASLACPLDGLDDEAALQRQAEAIAQALGPALR